MSINVSSNFDLFAQLPLDERTVVIDLTARDAIDAGQRYEGLMVYVLSDENRYVLRGGATNADWCLDIVADSAGLTTLPDSLIVPGMAAVGNDAQSGLVSGVMRFVENAQSVTDFTPTNSWRMLTNRLIVDPDANYTSDSANANFSQVMLATGNANNFGTLTGATSLAQHFGTGTITTQNGHVITSTLNDAGNITTNIVLGVSGVTQPAASGTITTNQVIVVQSGPTGPTSTITLNEGIHIRTPRPEGTTTTNRAIMIEDQVGPGTSHAIYSEGGQSYHEGNFGLGIVTPLSQLHVDGSISTKTTQSAIDYNVLTTDYYIGITDTSVARTVTLPSMANAGDGKTYIIMDESLAAGTNNITVDTADAALINGGASQPITTNGGSMTVRSNGTNWFII